MIKDVHLKPLITHTDERGYFRELIRSTDDFFDKFGQWSMSMMVEGVIKAWHIHNIQTDYWYIPPFGLIRVALYDTRTQSTTFGQIDEFLLGEYKRPMQGFWSENEDITGPAILTIPPGVAHGLKVMQGPAYLFYITSEVYNPDDEGRISIGEIDYDWGE